TTTRKHENTKTRKRRRSTAETAKPAERRALSLFRGLRGPGVYCASCASWLKLFLCGFCVLCGEVKRRTRWPRGSDDDAGQPPVLTERLILRQAQDERRVEWRMSRSPPTSRPMPSATVSFS